MRDTPTQTRLPHLDGLRGLAILLVLVTHAWAFTGAPSLAVKVFGATVVLAALPAVGYVGVSLFLVLSGFCLTWPFVSGPGRSLKGGVWGFWARRVRRIVPAYYLSIAAVVVLAVAFDRVWGHWHPGSELPRFAPLLPAGDLWSHLLFVHNLIPSHVSAINGSYWSLALEFQLYLLFPVFLAAMARFGVWRVAVAVLAVQVAFRLGLDHTLTAESLDRMQFVLPNGLLGRMFDFVVGMAAAHWVAAVRRNTASTTGARRGMLGAGCAVLVLAFGLTYFRVHAMTWVAALWPIGFGLLVCHTSVAESAFSRALTWRPLAALGLISYSVYLLHQPLLECAGFGLRLWLRPGSAFFAGLTLLPAVVGICAVFYWFCERPFLRGAGTKSERAKATASEEPHSAGQADPALALA